MVTHGALGNEKPAGDLLVRYSFRQQRESSCSRAVSLSAPSARRAADRAGWPAGPRARVRRLAAAAVAVAPSSWSVSSATHLGLSPPISRTSASSYGLLSRSDAAAAVCQSPARRVRKVRARRRQPPHSPSRRSQTASDQAGTCSTCPTAGRRRAGSPGRSLWLAEHRAQLRAQRADRHDPGPCPRRPIRARREHFHAPGSRRRPDAPRTRSGSSRFTAEVLRSPASQRRARLLRQNASSCST